MKFKLLVILIVAILPDCWGQPLRKIGKQQMLNDLQILRKSVEEVHPGLNRFGQEAGFAARYDSINTIISGRDSITALDFFRIVNPLLSSIKCGHVKFLPPVKDFPFYYYLENILPVIVRFDENNRLLIVKAQNDQLRGKYFSKINNRPIDEILEMLRANMFVDGNVMAAADAQIQQYFSAWYADFIQDQNSFLVEVTDHSGKREDVKLSGISVPQWQEMDKQVSFLSKKNELIFKNDSTAYLRIASFMPDVSNKDFSKFLSASFAGIGKKSVKKLIIDVRGNEGGNDKLGMELFAFIAQRDFGYYDRIEMKVRKRKNITYNKLAYFPRFSGLASIFIKKRKGKLFWTLHKNLGNHKPAKHAYTGEVVFLMDGLSYSVTSEFLAVAHDQSRGKFVGEESGGTYTGDNSGAFLIFKLPASSIDLGIPVAAYYAAVKSQKEIGRGILPDLVVKPTASDLLNNRDTVLNQVLEN
ncbi:S41 family peptidase [Dyadobacter diqingensis]|uniref:S41 family peptidase n=1 Tax=Dyadobacter diqingensis TaxID=2938121 RepID=UPI0020C566D4|nr:S41 family peptidase [Dyadobacter diqingensis]